MRHITARALPLVAAATLAATLAGCDSGGTGTATDTPSASPTSTASSTPSKQSDPGGYKLDADGCPILPHGYSLCSDGTDDLATQWVALPDESDEATGPQEVVNLSFSVDGTMTDFEGTTLGTWKYDGGDTITVRFDEGSAPLEVGAGELSLRVDEVVRACGEVENDLRDALVSTRPPLTFEPAVC